MKSTMIITAAVTALVGTLQAKQPEVKFAAHTNLTAGSSDLNEALVANHAHDPNDEFTVQGVELSTTVQFTDKLGILAAYNFFLDDEDKIDGEWEDAFFKAQDLPLGLGFRAGRIFNQTSSENNVHLHSWKFVNSSLLTTRFMGDEGLLTESLEVNWKLPFEQGPTLSLSYGDAVDHEHGEEEAGGAGTDIHGDESFLNTDIYTVNLAGTFLQDDFNQFHYLAHYSSGTNGYGLDGEIYGAKFGYSWRENGQEKGGKDFSVSAEWTRRAFDYSSEDGSITGSTGENGYALVSSFDFGNQWTVAARYEHLRGSTIVEETPRINRTSVALTRAYTINEQFGGHVRLQYDYEDRAEQDDSNSVWLQFQLDFGSAY